MQLLISLQIVGELDRAPHREEAQSDQEHDGDDDDFVELGAFVLREPLNQPSCVEQEHDNAGDQYGDSDTQYVTAHSALRLVHRRNRSLLGISGEAKRESQPPANKKRTEPGKKHDCDGDRFVELAAAMPSDPFHQIAGIEEENEGDSNQQREGNANDIPAKGLVRRLVAGEI